MQGGFFVWTKERKETLKRLHSEGHSYAEIAQRVGAPSRNSVGGMIDRLRDKGEIKSEVFRALAIKQPARNGHRPSPGLAHVPFIKQRLGEGRNDREIAKELGLKTDDVRYVRRVEGLKATGPSPAEARRKGDDIRRLALEGRSDPEIADELGLGVYQVREERRRQKIKRPAPPRVTNIEMGDPGTKVMAVFAEGFMGQKGRLSLLGLRSSGQCRYPIDQPNGGVRYCGDFAEDGASYCVHHAARCYVPSSSRTVLRPSHVYQPRW